MSKYCKHPLVGTNLSIQLQARLTNRKQAGISAGAMLPDGRIFRQIISSHYFPFKNAEKVVKKIIAKYNILKTVMVKVNKN